MIGRTRRRRGCYESNGGGLVSGSAEPMILPPPTIAEEGNHQQVVGRRRGRRSSIAIPSPPYTATTTNTLNNDDNGRGRSVVASRRRTLAARHGVRGGVEFQIPPTPSTTTQQTTIQQTMRSPPTPPLDEPCLNYIRTFNTYENIGRATRSRRRSAQGMNGSISSYNSQDNCGISSRRSRARRADQSSVSKDATMDTCSSESEEEPNNNDIVEEVDTDDDDECIEMPALTKKKVAKKKAAAYNHENSNPTTKSGVSIRRLGLIKAGFDDRRQQKVCERTNNERFSANYGVSAKTLEIIFRDMKKKGSSLTEHDFLMAVDTLKLYSTEHTMAGRWNCCEQTYREKWKKTVAAIAALREDKIKFDPSDFPEDQIFLLTVDGVNFSIREPRVKNPGSHWYDHKSHSAGLTYLVAIDVRSSRICWIDGPRPGK